MALRCKQDCKQEVNETQEREDEIKHKIEDGFEGVNITCAIFVGFKLRKY